MIRTLKAWVKLPIRACAEAVLAVIVVCVAVAIPKRRAKLVWGTTPIINNKYWSAAMARAGWDSVTLMEGFYGSINKREDFDILLDDLVPSFVRPAPLRSVLARCLGFAYILRNAKVLHLPAHGGPLAPFAFWFLEGWLLRMSGIRTVLIPYGSDVWMYSKTFDTSTRHGLLTCYPDAALGERKIARRLRYWDKYADVILSTFLIDGRGHWHVTAHNVLSVDVETWAAKVSYSAADGTSDPVVVVHAPNHRGYKGTEFLARAVEELQQEGLKIELRLLERIQNDRLREVMAGADILADQFINSGYGLAAVEGMALGLPVVANLELEARTTIFRRYGCLGECPIVSGPPERLKATLRTLARNPELREALGRAGRQYVEKYHSYETAQYMFGAIYDKLLLGRDIDLLNLFHPIKSAYNRRRPVVEHPLIDNRLPGIAPGGHG